MQVAQSSAALVAWGNAWLTGHVGLDEAADAIERVAGPHVVVGIPGDEDEAPLRRGLAGLRVDGMTGLRLALPAPGDLLGLTGPPSLNMAALGAGAAVIGTAPGHAVGLVPAEDRRGSSYVGTRWTAAAARPGEPDVPSLPEADHRLAVAVREATDSLLTVDDVSTWRPEIAEALSALRESHRQDETGGLAPGYPARAHRLAALAGRLAVVVDLARGLEGHCLTAEQSRRRSEALAVLDRAVRRARVAACNSVLDTVP